MRKFSSLNSFSKVKKILYSDALNGLLLLSPSKLKAKGPRFMALVCVGIVSIIWGTTWIISKQAVLEIPALEMAGLRQLIGGCCYLAYFKIKKFPLPDKKDILPLLVLSFLNFILSNGLSTWGVKFIPAGLASIIGAIFPLWLVLISIFISKNSPPKMALAGVIIGFVGICTIFYDHLTDFLDPNFRFGIILSIIATVSWAIGTLYTKKHSKSFNPYFGLGFQMVISGVVLSGISLFDPQFVSIPDISWMTWLSILYLVVFGSVIGFICYLYALQHLPAQQASVYAYINPLVALIAGYFILGEKITSLIIIGCGITIFGVYLVNRSYLKK